MKKTLSLATLSAAMLSAPLASLAATDTTDFDVRLTLTASCTIDSAADMDFGPLSEAAVATGTETATSDIAVTCSNGTSYDIGLSNTNNTSEMVSAGGSTVSYNLFQDAGNSTAWDSANSKSATSTGAQDIHTVYGLLPGNVNVAAADNLDGDTGVALSDTVTVTLTF